MKTIQKVALGTVIVALSGAAAYPHIDTYLKSLPQKMTKEQAGKRYLQAVCPDVAIVDKINKAAKELKKELSISYPVGSDALANANARVGALNNNLISLTHRRVETLRASSKKLMDPKFIWPEDVRKDVETVADNNFALAGGYSLFLREGGELPMGKDGNASDRIRRKLNLPIRGVCPANLTK